MPSSNALTIGDMITESQMDTDSNQVNHNSLARGSTAPKRLRENEYTSPSTNSESAKSRQKISGDPAPLLFFDLKPDKRNREHIIIQLKQANIYDAVKEFRITNNGNLLIYPSTIINKQVILNCSAFLPEATKLDLALEDNGPMIIIKGSSFTYLSNHTDELRSYGIIKMFKIVNKSSEKELNLVKALVKDISTKDELLKHKHIYINKLRHFVEGLTKHPVQCGACKRFGHKEDSCTGHAICSHCAEQHDEYFDCSIKPSKCANCNLSHSSFYRGCKIFQQIKNELNSNKANASEVYQKYSTLNSTNTVSSGFTRVNSYSEATKKDELFDKLDKLSQNQQEHFEKQNKNFEEFKGDIVSIKKKVEVIEANVSEMNTKTDIKIAENNKSMFGFFVDIFKLLSPKSDFNKLKPVADRFNAYNLQLGGNEQSQLSIENRRNSVSTQSTLNSANPFIYSLKW